MVELARDMGKFCPTAKNLKRLGRTTTQKITKVRGSRGLVPLRGPGAEPLAGLGRAQGFRK